MKAKKGHTCDPGPVVSKGHFNFLGADYSLNCDQTFRSYVRNGKMADPSCSLIGLNSDILLLYSMKQSLFKRIC